MNAPVLDFNDAPRVLRESVRAGILESANRAYVSGTWSREQMATELIRFNLTKEDYDAAVKAGQPVSDQVRINLETLYVQDPFAAPPPGALAPDRAAIFRHLEWLTDPARGEYDDALVEIAWPHDPATGQIDSARLFGLEELSAAADFATNKNAQGFNLYVGASLKLPDTVPNKRTTGAAFYVATAVPIDIDEEYDATRARMAAVVDDGLVVVTGRTPERRSQHWTRLSEPCDDDLAFGHAFAALVAHSGADMRVKDYARVMRLGGTVSYPSTAKIARGYKTELTAVTVRDQARPAVVTVLQALEPDASVARKFDASGRPAGPSGVVRKAVLGMPGLGVVVDGREEHFRNLLLSAIRVHQADTGLDPEPADLWQAAFEEFSDPSKVDNSDGRWTGPDGIKQLEARTMHTLRRLRAGQLARVGLYSRETLNGQEDAERIQANRRATERPAYAAGVAPGHGEPEPSPAPVPGVDRYQEGQATVEPEGPTPHLIFDPWQRWLTPNVPADCLPPVVRDFAVMQSASTGADFNACAMAALAACSGAISHGFSLKMKRSGDWAVGPRLWVMLVGSSSAMKTPAINGAMGPLKAVSHEIGAKHRKDVQRWKDAKEVDPNAEKPPEPLRLISNDTSAEKLGEILARQDRGILFEGDELSGWLGAMDRYSGGGKGSSADRAFWLEAYNGGSKYIDRIGRGEIFIEKCSVSILGGIQPAKLEAMGNLASDGLLQRFLPVMMRKAERSAEVHDTGTGDAYAALIRYLVDVQPCRLLMDDEALDVAKAFQGFTYDMMQVEGLGESFLSFLGKLNGVHGSLMLLLHTLADPREGPYSPVTAATAQAATRILREFAVPHALALYQTSADGVDWDYLRALASYVLTSDKNRFTVSDFTSGVHALRGLGVWEVGQKLSPLVAGGWLAEEETKGVVKAWSVIPGTREIMADRRASEAVRKAEFLKAYRDLSGKAERAA